MVVRRIDEPLADAQAWAEWFNAQITDLPLLRQTHRRIDELTRHAAEINLHELASVVLADPLLTLRTLVTVHQRKRAASRDLTGITSALI
jgi:HD-like signal output (HDOD) protein